MQCRARTVLKLTVMSSEKPREDLSFDLFLEETLASKEATLYNRIIEKYSGLSDTVEAKMPLE